VIEMKSVVLIGGTFSNLVTAIELSQTHHITLIELNAEIGLPSISPGYIQNQELLTHYLTPKQIKFLQLHKFEEGFTLRSEWGLKHLAVHAAVKGVEIFTRTRITDCVETGNGFSIEFQGGGPNSSGRVDCHSLINDIQWTYQAPGAKLHTLPDSAKIHTPEFGTFCQMHGGTALKNDCVGIPDGTTTLPRFEGLTEVWQTSEDWVPKKGWIETIDCFLPTLVEKRCIDVQINEGRRISQLLK
tara:strand:+ start:507 stop:1235 length:729 start_codon:yes stop_codon:yes gene_type:complete